MARGPKRAPRDRGALEYVSGEPKEQREHLQFWEVTEKIMIIEREYSLGEYSIPAQMSIKIHRTRSISHSSIKRAANDSDIKRLIRRSQAFDMLQVGKS